MPTGSIAEGRRAVRRGIRNAPMSERGLLGTTLGIWMIKRGVPLLIIGLWLSSSAGAAQFYKWVDEQGRVHYSDAVPPDAAGQQREVKSSSGETVQTIEPPPTREQLDAKQREHETAQRAERRRRAQSEYDRTLLLTFSSAQEIRAAREDRLRAISAQIELSRKRLEKLQSRLQVQRRKAVRIERTGRGDPTTVYAQIAQLQGHIDENEAFIERKRAEQEQTRQDFDRHLSRYRELMAAREDKAHEQHKNP